MDNFGKKFGEAAVKVAKEMGGNKSVGKCALAVGNALALVLGENIACKFRGNAHTWLPKIKQSALGGKYWSFLRKSKDTTNLPAGSLVIWDKQEAHPYGHIEVADGNGHLCSDFVRSDKLALYKSNPANVIPEIFAPIGYAANNGETKVPFNVEVIVDGLNIRKLSNTTAPIIGNAKKGDVLTVWAIENKEDGSQWGKNATGYFCLINENKKRYTKNI